MALSSMSKNPVDDYLPKSYKPQPGGLLSFNSLIGPQDPDAPSPSIVQKILPDYSKSTPEQQKVADAIAWGIRNTIKNDTPYELSKSAKEKNLAPNLTCIGGACNFYKNLGLDFSAVGNEEAGVRESNEGGKVVEYNPTFAKNYDKAGFIKLKDKDISNEELTDMIGSGLIKKGDIVQYINEKTGIPEHSNVIYDVRASKEDPGYTVYNAHKHSNAVLSGNEDPYIYQLNPKAASFQNKRYNVYRLSDEKAKELVQNDTGGKLSKSLTEVSINNEVADIVKQLQKEAETNKYESKQRYGTEKPSQEMLQQLANKKYISKLQYQTDPAVWIHANRNNSNFTMSNKFAQELANEAKKKLELYLQGQEYGASPFTFQQRNRMKVALSK